MKTKSNNDSIYIGREAGKEIHEKIRNAKSSVKVVSPYLSADYIKDLIVLHQNGIEVMLITCDKISDSAYSDFKVSDLVKQEKTFDEKLKHKRKIGIIMSLTAFLLIFLISISAIIANHNLFNLAFKLGFFGCVISLGSFSYFFFIKPYKIECKPIFRIKVFDSHSGRNPESTELIHSKIFIIDEEVAFLGSVNLTYSGFKTHYETAIKIEDPAAVKEISEEIERLYHSSELAAKSVEDWDGS